MILYLTDAWLINTHAQTVTQLLNGSHRCAVVPAADNVFHSGLGNAADGAQLVDGHIMFGA